MRTSSSRPPKPLPPHGTTSHLPLKLDLVLDHTSPQLGIQPEIARQHHPSERDTLVHNFMLIVRPPEPPGLPRRLPQDRFPFPRGGRFGDEVLVFVLPAARLVLCQEPALPTHTSNQTVSSKRLYNCRRLLIEMLEKEKKEKVDGLR